MLRSTLRSTFRSSVGLLTLFAAAQLAGAQEPSASERRWEFRLTSGEFVPAGSQRRFLKDAQTTAAQLSFLLQPTLAVTGTFSWASSRDLTMEDTPKLDVFTSDLGIEVRPAEWFAGHAVTLSPFVGLGAGVRSYNYRSLDVDATHNVAGYGTVGGEIGVGRVGVRVEARDYTSGFRPLIGGGKSATRNDVVLSVALRFNRRHTTQQ